MNDGLAGSVESALHTVAGEVGARSFYFSLRDAEAREGALGEILGHRAIGVVYRPEFERFGNYVPTSLARRYDAFLFVDETTALSPLIQPFDRRDIPETFPAGE
jgi:erythromycin esterase-like protein